MRKSLSAFTLAMWRTALFAGLCLSPYTAAAALPPAIPYTGFLTYSNGEAFNGSVTITAGLYASAAPDLDNDTPLWGPHDYGSVNVQDGFVSIVLGGSADPITPLQLSADPTQVWLLLTVNDTPLLPAQRVQSVPFALIAQQALSVGNLDSADVASLNDVDDAVGALTGALQQIGVDPASALSINNGRLYAPSGAGPVGIGTSSPAVGAALEVAGQVKITGGSPGNGKVLTSNAEGLASWQSPPAPGSFAGDVSVSGHLGIGTTAQPSSQLAVRRGVADGGGSNTVSLQDVSGVSRLRVDQDHSLRMSNALGTDTVVVGTGGSATFAGNVSAPAFNIGYQIVTNHCDGAFSCIALCPAPKRALGGGCVSSGYQSKFGGNTLGCTDGTFGGDCNSGWICRLPVNEATSIRTTVICANVF
jgi:hypothetical protein